jgi:hypothetical protein
MIALLLSALVMIVVVSNIINNHSSNKLYVALSHKEIIKSHVSRNSSFTYYAQHHIAVYNV